MTTNGKPPKRAATFMPDLLKSLKTTKQFRMKFSDLPKSYQKQPYNLVSKIEKRGGIKTKIVFNRTQDIAVFISI